MSSAKKNEIAEVNWDRVTETFESLARLPSDERKKKIVEGKLTDPELFAEVESLLEAHDSAGEFMLKPVVESFSQTLRNGSTEIPWRAGDTIGDLRILKVLGSGNFATVYLGEQISLQRRAAIKISRGAGEEARTMAGLEHDNIVKVFFQEAVPDTDFSIVCMQYIPGVTLERLIRDLKGESTLDGASVLERVDALVRDQEISWDPVTLKYRQYMEQMDFLEVGLWIGMKLADALSYAHGKSVLHMDVKPGNILISPTGRPLLTDFNVSLNLKDFDNTSRYVGGTVDYMAPEHLEVFFSPDKQKAIRQLDFRTDIYSLGVVLRKFLQLKYPELGSSEPPQVSSWRRTLTLGQSPELTPPEQSPGEPETKATAPRETRAVDRENIVVHEVARLLARCGAPDPKNRFQSARELSQAFESCLNLHRICKRLKSGTALTRFLVRHPLLALTFFGAIPQAVATCFSISYNSLHIVSTLSSGQQDLFQRILNIYNPVMYLIGIGIWVYLFMPLLNFLKTPASAHQPPSDAARLRRHTLSIPLWVFGITTIGWIPGSVLFPLILHRNGPPLEPGMFVHFLASFVLWWLIAFSYSFLANALIVMRSLYPRMWAGTTNIQEHASKELRVLHSWLRFVRYLPGVIPLLAICLVFLGTDEAVVGSYATLRLLVVSLVAVGVGGIFFSSRASETTLETIRTFTRG